MEKRPIIAIVGIHSTQTLATTLTKLADNDMVIVQQDQQNPFAPEPVVISNPYPVKEQGDFGEQFLNNKNKRSRAIRREQERKNKPKKRYK